MEQFDLIVAGAGAAGLCAAIIAGQSGAQVLLIEAADRVGGTFHLSSGQMSAAGTRLQAARGIEDSPKAHYEDVMRISRGGAHPGLLKLATDHAADTLHWLLDNGLEVMPDHPVIHYGHEPYLTPRTYWGPEEGRSVLKVLAPLLDAQIAVGAVTLWLSSPLVSVVQDNAGRVIGVRAARDGEIREARGSSVLLTTGGYASNPARFPLLSAGQPLFGGGYAFSQGDGLSLVEALGGRIINKDKFLPTFAGVQEPTAPGGVTLMTQTYPQFRGPWEVYVDVQGRRFMREDEPSVDSRERSLLAQPDLTFWAVYDEAIRAAAPPFFFTLEPEAVLARFNVMPGYVSAPTLDALAGAMGASAGALIGAITAYNLAQATGAPDVFGRVHRPAPIAEGPFYAVRHRGWSVVGFAGAEVDLELRVMHASGRPIEGLYAAGELLGLAALSGNAFVGGMSVTPAMTFGRLLGARLAGTAVGTRAVEAGVTKQSEIA